ncbi:B12-binding domain-containing radical SAM protein [Paenibacillus tepidiphilus]|uniref:B12-binding domain-containing radical SAM protein n=1 Tax=Paenibacillus tepidiphilus TaxID=2608683 RepID=UPI0012384A14|nr:radical SAM protein [Paenibacillus tepidiphilus]
MKKFIFVSLTDGFINRNLLNVGYLCSALKKVEGITTEVLFYDMSELDTAIEDLAQHKPWMVGMSVMQYNFQGAIEFAQKVKERLPLTKIVLGGLEATKYSQYILTHYPAIDMVCLGESELTLPDLCRRILHGDSLAGCKGVHYRDNDVIVENEPRELVMDLDSLDFPDRSFCNDELTVHNVIGSRGCFAGCTYCEANCIFSHNQGPRVRVRSMKNVLDEIESLLENGTYGYIGFADYTFSTNVNNSQERLIQLYDGILERKLNIQFSLFVRAEQISPDYVQMLLKLHEVGLDRILIGLEFGTKEELKLYRKTAKLEDNERALRLLDEGGIINGKAGIILDIGFIPFHAYSTMDTLRSNISFIRRHKLVNICAAMENRMYISGSTMITRQLERDGLLNHDISKPLINPFCYSFRDPRVGVVYASFVKVMGILELEKIPTKILSNYVTYQKHFEPAFDFAEIHEKYLRISTAVLDLLDEIVDTIEAGIQYNHEDSLLFQKYRTELFEISRELVLKNNIIAKKLLRINKLAIPDLNKIYVEDAKKAALID